MSVAAISLDGDGTLWDFETSMRAALRRSAEGLNDAGLRHAGGPIEADWLAAVREQVAAEPRLRGATMAAIRLAAFEAAIGRCDPGRIDLAASVCDRYMADRLTELRLYPEVAEALAGLRGRYRLAVVTNGNTDPARVGLGETFAEVLFASDIGMQKPDPRIFELAAERLGVEAGACVHVGDHPHEDVDAARRAGMRSIWLNRDAGAWPGSLAPPEAEIADLASLAEAL